MKLIDFVILGVIALAMFFAFRRVHRKKRQLLLRVCELQPGLPHGA